MSLFDVSDPSNPQRISTLPIGGQSEVEWDHKAFLFWEPDGTIVLPVSPGWGDCGPAVDCLAKGINGAGGGAVVAELDGRELTARGTISHGDSNLQGCWNPLQRSIAIGDELVTIGLDQMKFSDRQTLEPHDSVAWGNPNSTAAPGSGKADRYIWGLTPDVTPQGRVIGGPPAVARSVFTSKSPGTYLTVRFDEAPGIVIDIRHVRLGASSSMIGWSPCSTSSRGSNRQLPMTHTPPRSDPGSPRCWNSRSIVAVRATSSIRYATARDCRPGIPA